MEIQLHTPKGIVEIDPDNVTDSQLAKLKTSREALAELIVRNPLAELDDLRVELKSKGVID